MDLNVVILCGRVAAQPEYRSFNSGSSLVRLLVTVRSDTPARRIDLIPVVKWDPSEELGSLVPGTRVWVKGLVQRRFWDSAANGERHSRLEIVAEQVDVKYNDESLAQV